MLFKARDMEKHMLTHDYLFAIVTLSDDILAKMPTARSAPFEIKDTKLCVYCIKGMKTTTTQSVEGRQQQTDEQRQQQQLQ